MPMPGICSGRLAERGNDLNAAAAALKEAIAVKADLVDAHYNLAFVYRSQGVLAEAEREFLEVLRYRPEYAEAHLNLGMVYTSLNRLEDAEREYERAVALKPNSAEAHYNLGFLRASSQGHGSGVGPIPALSRPWRAR